jgi:hypothetical protein
MDSITIDAGTLTASEEDRTVSGLLVPYGEDCRSNLGKFSVGTGAFSIPSDATVAGLNIEHVREDGVGRAATLSETDQGIVATFSVARTPEGDQALADIKSGKRKHLSAEVANVVIKAGKAVGGRLFGAALVEKPAFPSATLLAAAADTEEPAAQEREIPDGAEKPLALADGETTFSTQTDEAGVTTSTTTTVGDAEADESGVTTQKTTVTDVTVTPSAAQPTDQESEATVPNAAVPSTLNASAHATDKVDMPTFLATLSGAVRTQDPTLMASLSDIKISGTGAVGTGVVVPEYVGEIWSGRQYQRKVIPLLTQGSLTSLTTQGWRFTQAPEVSEWAGNKADVPSNAPKTEPVTWDMQRFAGGWDIAREFIDFGETAVLDSFLRKAADSYAKKSDNWMLGKLLAGATVAGVGTGIPEGVGDGFAKIIRGALRVIASDATPSYALIAPDLYEEFMFTKKDDTLAFLTTTIGLEEGSLENFRIVPHAGVDAGEVLVGAREAAGAYEMAGSPIRVNALDIARGGIDEALFGYIQARIEYPTGLQLVTDNA